MELYQNLCKNCGGDLHEIEGGRYKCAFCGSIFEAAKVKDYAEEMRRLFDDFKLEAISNARKNLYEAVNAEYISTQLVHECAMALKQLLPDDFQANFYELAIGNNPRKIAKAIRKLDVKENECHLDTMVRFLIVSLQSEFVTETGDLIERAYKGTDLTKYEKFSTELSVEAEKIDNCIYMTSYPRDVFVAYSSKDMDKVMELVECLEEQGFSCFVAARNLRHGRGAVENYESALKEAMDNCQSFVFVSSTNSRHPGCDALKREIPYIKSVDLENAPPQMRQDYAGIPHKYKKHRVEYRIEESPRPMAADRVVSEFFNGYERVYSPDEVADRLMNRPVVFDDEPVAPVVQQKKTKFCISCVTECDEDSKACPSCGGAKFASTVTEAELMQKIATLEKEKAALESRETESAIAPSHTPAPVSSPIPTAKSTPKIAPKPASIVVPSAIPKANDNLKFELNDNGESYLVIGITDFKEKCVIIPAEYKGKPVTKIGKYAFNGLPNLTSITIPDSITTIEHYAFQNCKKLTSITIPESVTSIGEHAFEHCSHLKSINIPTGIKEILYDTFSGCKTLTNIIIPEGVTSIGNRAFQNCKSLTSITIPEGVSSIKSYAFSGCTRLASVDFKKASGWNVYYGIKRDSLEMLAATLSKNSAAARCLVKYYHDYDWRRR